MTPDINMKMDNRIMGLKMELLNESSSLNNAL